MYTLFETLSPALKKNRQVKNISRRVRGRYKELFKTNPGIIDEVPEDTIYVLNTVIDELNVESKQIDVANTVVTLHSKYRKELNEFFEFKDEWFDKLLDQIGIVEEFEYEKNSWDVADRLITILNKKLYDEAKS